MAHHAAAAGVAQLGPRLGAQQRLAAGREGHDAGRRGLRDALDLHGLGPPGHVVRAVLDQHHLAGVQPGPGPQGAAKLRGEGAQRGVVRDGVGDGIFSGAEDVQETVGLVDLAPAVRGEQVAGHAVVAGRELGRLRVPERARELRAVDEVGEQQGQRLGGGHASSGSGAGSGGRGRLPPPAVTSRGAAGPAPPGPGPPRGPRRPLAAPPPAAAPALRL
ncbi:MAG: hypothetical protein ACK559_15775, partial [bacterium]